MKRSIFILLLLTIVTFLFIWGTGKNTKYEYAIQAIDNLFEQRSKTLDSFLNIYPKYFYDSSHKVRQQKYEELAYHFKQTAGFLLYFDNEVYYKKLIAPFQFEKSQRKGLSGLIPDNFIMAGSIGSETDSFLLKRFIKKDSVEWKYYITDATINFRKAIKEICDKARFTNLNASTLFDAMRMEIFRISTIDIANADFIVESAGIPSLNGSLDTWLLFTNELVNVLPASEGPLRQHWNGLQMSTRAYLADHKDFRTFDRMIFIKNNLIPLSKFLNDLQVSLEVPYLKKFSAFRASALHAYEKNIFNADYFAPDKNGYYSAQKAELGELLFFDPILSDNNKRACASCHKPGLAFTDAQVKSTSFDMGSLPRNSPTIINSVFQKKQFWDQRTGSLEDQLDSVINNPSELHSSFERVIDKINSSKEYIRLFNKAFPGTIKKGIKKDDVKNAIGVYERTLVGLNSRFDQYMNGNERVLSQKEINGFNLYMGKARCGNCHFAPLFNGALPPFYEITDHHSLGVPVKDTMDKFKLDPDNGVFASTGNEFTRFSFKTPILRNASLTSPYMHNGVYKTLEQVINFYDHGAGTKFSRDMRPDMGALPFFTIIPFPLNLTDTEKKELISFLHAITDTSVVRRMPSRLPELKGKYAPLNKRTIGGDY